MLRDPGLKVVTLQPAPSQASAVGAQGYAEKLERAKAMLGERYLLHPQNMVSRKPAPPPILSAQSLMQRRFG